LYYTDVTAFVNRKNPAAHIRRMRFYFKNATKTSGKNVVISHCPSEPMISNVKKIF